MRRLAVLLAACSSGSPAVDKQPPAPPPQAKKVLEPITGAHGGSINTIAATSDGRAAVTGDVTGGLRLWPRLDGTREPIVIAGPVATALAIGRDGAGFAIAVTDAADHVVLIRVDNKGHVRGRQQLGTALQVELIGDSVLALRAEQVIDHIAFDGTLHGQLPAEAGTRVDSMLVNGAHVVAMIATEKARHARRIDLVKLAWGETSAALPLAEVAPAVLSPDGAGIIAMGVENRIMRFDFATAKAKPACPPAQIAAGHRGGFDHFGNAVTSLDAPLGVVGDRVACFVDNTLTWFDPVTAGRVTAAFSNGVPTTMVATADRLIVASDHQLAIAVPDRIDYVGYGFRDLTHVRAVPTGLMIGKGDQNPVLLDDAFRERTRFALPRLRVDWTDLVPIDDRYIIASSTRPGSGDLWGSAYQVAVYDAVKQVMHQVLPHRARTGELVFEPATNLLVTTDGTRTLLAKYDPTTHSFGGEVRLELADAPKQVVLLDPKLAGGLVALAIRDEGGGGLMITEFHRADLPPAQEVADKQVRSMKPRKTYRVAGELRGVDRAGRLYVHNIMQAGTVGIYLGGTHVAQLDGAQAAKLRASPDGRHVVAIDSGKLTLFTTSGQRVWETAAWGSSDVDWSAAGVLFARFPNALARIDADTGALAERQCGWAFGIWTSARDGSSSAPSICDVSP